MIPMKIEEIEKKVNEVLAEKSSMDLKQIRPESSLVGDLGLDSLDAVEMVFELEEVYGIEIPDEKIQEFKKPIDIVDYLAERLVSP